MSDNNEDYNTIRLFESVLINSYTADLVDDLSVCLPNIDKHCLHVCDDDGIGAERRGAAKVRPSGGGRWWRGLSPGDQLQH